MYKGIIIRYPVVWNCSKCENNPKFSKWIFNMVFAQISLPDFDPAHSNHREVTA